MKQGNTGSITFRILIVSGLLLLTALFLGFRSGGKDVPILKPLSTFPTRIGDWRGKVERFDEKVYEILGVDDSLLCDYRRPDGRWVNLYIGYYQSQREGDIIHSPKNCMPGSGWNIVKRDLVDVPIPGAEPGRFKAIKLVLRKGSNEQVMLYWFQSRGRFIHSEYQQKIYLVLDSIFKNRTDGSFVRLIAPVTSTEKETTESLKTFAQGILPILEQYLPGA